MMMIPVRYHMLFALLLSVCLLSSRTVSGSNPLDEAVRAVSHITQKAVVRVDVGLENVGVIISSQGHMLVHGHAPEPIVNVRLADGQEVKAKVLQEIAPLYTLLKADLVDHPHVVLGNSQSIAAGDVLVRYDNRFGVSEGIRVLPSVSSGSCMARLDLPGPGIEQAILIDDPVSNGPVFDLSGQLIGMVYGSFNESLPNVNMEPQVVVPVNHLIEHMPTEVVEASRSEQIKSNRLLAGVRVSTSRQPSGGVLVEEVLPGSIADISGIRVGDLITHINDQSCGHDFLTVVRRLNKCQPNEINHLTIHRDRELISLPFLVTAPEAAEAASIGGALRAIAQKAQPVMVRLKVTRERTRAIGSEKTQSSGFRAAAGDVCGVVLTPDGYIATASVNLIGWSGVEAVLSDGRRLPAQVLGTDTGRNITLLKVQAWDLPVIDFVDNQELKVGSWVLSLGFMGDQVALSRGHLSAHKRFAGKATQIDSLLSAMNYGGLTCDMQGRALGINIPAASLGGGVKNEARGTHWSGAGIGFVVPMADVLRSFAVLRTGRNLEPAFLGIRFNSDHEGSAKIESIVRRVGIYKEGVTQADLRSVTSRKDLDAFLNYEETGAWAAGLRDGDEIVSYEGQRISHWVLLLNAIGSSYAGDTVSFTIKRGNRDIEVEATLGRRGIPEAPDYDSEEDDEGAGGAQP